MTFSNNTFFCLPILLDFQRLLANGELEKQLLHAIIQKGNIQARGVVVQEQQQQNQKKKISSDLFATLIQQMKKEYKEQIGNLEKILQFKHPPIID